MTLVAAADSRADGDPASDVLYADRVFFPYSTSISAGARHALTTTVGRSERAGYPIRVALIAGPFDLGAVTSLWGKPRDYARFLDYELSLVYNGPLLVVMPSGIGFAHYKHSTAREYRTIASLHPPTGPDGLAVTAIKAITAIATEAGHPISPASMSGNQGVVVADGDPRRHRRPGPCGAGRLADSLGDRGERRLDPGDRLGERFGVGRLQHDLDLAGRSAGSSGTSRP